MTDPTSDQTDKPSGGLLIGMGVDEDITLGLGLYTETGITDISTIRHYPFRSTNMEEDSLEFAISEYAAELGDVTCKSVKALSISAFGITHDYMTSTFMRPGWREKREIIWSNILPAKLEHAPIFLYNDATCAGLGEYLSQHKDLHQSAQKKDQAFAYIRVGAGVNIGLVINGRPWEGALHPEFGHIRPRRMEGDTRKGICEAHQDCFEGLLCTKALEPSYLRGQPPRDAILAYYIAEMCELVRLTIAPERIALGGSAMTKELHAKVLEVFEKTDKEPQTRYPFTKQVAEVSSFIVEGRCGPQANLIGALEWGRSLLTCRG